MVISLGSPGALYKLGPFRFEDGAQVFGHRHRPERADIGAARVANRHPDPREQRRGENARALPEQFAQVAPQPANVPHREMGLHVQPGEALAEDVGALQMLKSKRQVAGAARLLGAAPFVGVGGADRCGHGVDVDGVQVVGLGGSGWRH